MIYLYYILILLIYILNITILLTPVYTYEKHTYLIFQIILYLVLVFIHYYIFVLLFPYKKSYILLTIFALFYILINVLYMTDYNKFYELFLFGNTTNFIVNFFLFRDVLKILF